MSHFERCTTLSRRGKKTNGFFVSKKCNANRNWRGEKLTEKKKIVNFVLLQQSVDELSFLGSFFEAHLIWRKVEGESDRGLNEKWMRKWERERESERERERKWERERESEREREKEREKFFSVASQLRKLAYFSCQTASNSKLPSPNRFSAEAEAREQMKIWLDDKFSSHFMTRQQTVLCWNMTNHGTWLKREELKG